MRPDLQRPPAVPDTLTPGDQLLAAGLGVGVAASGLVMLVTLLIPVTATALGVLVLDETLTIYQIAGALIIASGLIVIDGRLLGPFPA